MGAAVVVSDRIQDLVDYVGPAADRRVLRYNGSLQKYQPAALAIQDMADFYGLRASAPGALVPSDLTWELLSVQRPFALMACSRFKQYSSRFASQELATFTQASYFSLGAPALTRTGDVLTFTTSAQQIRTLTARVTVPAPFETVSLRVTAITAAGGATQAAVGFFRNDQNYLAGYYDRATTQLFINGALGGVGSGQIGTVTRTLAFPFTLYATLCGKDFRLYVDEGNGVEMIAGYDTSGGWDLQTPGTLALWKPGFMVYGAATGAVIKVNQFECGLHGQTGLIGGTIVTKEDGAPLIRDGKVYFLFDSEAPGTTGTLTDVQATHQSIWSYDYTTGAMEETAKLFFLDGGKVYGHNNMALVFDTSANVWRWVVATWGKFTGVAPNDGVDLLYGAEDPIDLLNGVHVLSAEATITPAASAYDPGIVKIGGQWYLAAARTPARAIAGTFNPAIYRGASLSGALTQVMYDGTVNAEGSRIYRIAGTYYAHYALSNNGSQRVYNLTTGVRLAPDIQPLAIAATSPPHCTIVPVPSPGGMRFVGQMFDLETFNGINWTGGNVYWLRSQEFAWREFDRFTLPQLG